MREAIAAAKTSAGQSSSRMRCTAVRACMQYATLLVPSASFQWRCRSCGEHAGMESIHELNFLSRVRPYRERGSMKPSRSSMTMVLGRLRTLHGDFQYSNTWVPSSIPPTCMGALDSKAPLLLQGPRHDSPDTNAPTPVSIVYPPCRIAAYASTDGVRAGFDDCRWPVGCCMYGPAVRC